MSNPSVTVTQKDLLRSMATGTVLVGVLGEDPMKPNIRIFHTSDGNRVEQNTATSLIKRGLVKVISMDGPRYCAVITEAGRLMAERGQIKVRGTAYNGRGDD